jgi:hypothetical protein
MLPPSPPWHSSHDGTRALALCQAPLRAVLLAVVPRSEAITIPHQESTGSQSSRGSIPPNPSAASMSSYTMEGLKKRGIDAKARKERMEEVKVAAAAGKMF